MILFFPNFENVSLKDVYERNFRVFSARSILNLSWQSVKHLWYVALGRLIGIFRVTPPTFVPLRVNLDHFGAWSYLLLFCNSRYFSYHKKYLVLARYIPDASITSLLPRNVQILTEDFQFFAMSPIFYSKFAIQIFPEHRLVPKQFPWNFVLADVTENNIRNRIDKSPLLNHGFREDLVSSAKIGVFGRDIGWKYSVGRSRRNLNLDTLQGVVIGLLDNRFRVLRFGGNHLPNLKITHKNYFDTCGDQLELSHGEIERKVRDCDFILGSISGATHYPHFILCKPTLYLGYSPLWHTFVCTNRMFDGGTLPKNSWWLMNRMIDKRTDTLLSVEAMTQLECACASNTNGATPLPDYIDIIPLTPQQIIDFTLIVLSGVSFPHPSKTAQRFDVYNSSCLYELNQFNFRLERSMNLEGQLFYPRQQEKSQ